MKKLVSVLFLTTILHAGLNAAVLDYRILGFPFSMDSYSGNWVDAAIYEEIDDYCTKNLYVTNTYSKYVTASGFIRRFITKPNSEPEYITSRFVIRLKPYETVRIDLEDREEERFGDNNYSFSDEIVGFKIDEYGCFVGQYPSLESIKDPHYSFSESSQGWYVVKNKTYLYGYNGGVLRMENDTFSPGERVYVYGTIEDYGVIGGGGFYYCYIWMPKLRRE